MWLHGRLCPPASQLHCRYQAAVMELHLPANRVPGQRRCACAAAHAAPPRHVPALWRSHALCCLAGSGWLCQLLAASAAAAGGHRLLREQTTGALRGREGQGRLPEAAGCCSQPAALHPAECPGRSLQRSCWACAAAAAAAAAVNLWDPEVCWALELLGVPDERSGRPEPACWPGTCLACCVWAVRHWLLLWPSCVVAFWSWGA